MLVKWNQPPGWTSFSASAQPVVQVQLLDAHLKLHKATNRVELNYIKNIIILISCASNVDKKDTLNRKKSQYH